MRVSWEEMFEELKAYNREHCGSCKVPVRDGKLGRWVDRQRTLYRLNKLPPEHVTLLNSVGFVWQIRKPRQLEQSLATITYDNKFETMLGKVKHFKESEGHCCVLQRYEKDPALGLWVKNRRSEKAKGT
jgi:hypothetical protein